jgi:hypothetical protein
MPTELIARLFCESAVCLICIYEVVVSKCSQIMGFIDQNVIFLSYSEEMR